TSPTVAYPYRFPKGQFEWWPHYSRRWPLNRPRPFYKARCADRNPTDFFCAFSAAFWREAAAGSADRLWPAILGISLRVPARTPRSAPCGNRKEPRIASAGIDAPADNFPPAIG